MENGRRDCGCADASSVIETKDQVERIDCRAVSVSTRDGRWALAWCWVYRTIRMRLHHWRFVGLKHSDMTCLLNDLIFQMQCYTMPSTTSCPHPLHHAPIHGYTTFQCRLGYYLLAPLVVVGFVTPILSSMFVCRSSADATSFPFALRG
jgi:hypothetical protein